MLKSILSGLKQARLLKTEWISPIPNNFVRSVIMCSLQRYLRFCYTTNFCWMNLSSTFGHIFVDGSQLRLKPDANNVLIFTLYHTKDVEPWHLIITILGQLLTMLTAFIYDLSLISALSVVVVVVVPHYHPSTVLFFLKHYAASWNAINIKTQH